MSLLKMSELDLRGKRVMIREDFNVPMEKGQITSMARIDAALPTIRQALDDGAQVILLSHLGRPTEGSFQEEFSLAPVAEALEKRLQHPVKLVRDWLSGIQFENNEVILCENVRFNAGEKADDEALARQMATLADVFVMDAFATAHRAEASTHGVAKYAPFACAGPLLCTELEALKRILENPTSPFMAIVGGSKVSSKLTILEKLLQKVDQLIVGGGIANTFLAAKGYGIGDSLYEAAFLPQAHDLLALAQSRQVNLLLPEDVVVATDFAADAKSRVCSVEEIFPNERILDIGPKTAAAYAEYIQKAGTIMWNGPVGVFEFDAFSNGTRAISKAVAQSQAFSVAGGGDTIAAIEKFGVAEKISYISTGGGAFLEFIEGKILPAVEILQIRAAAMLDTSITTLQ